MSEEQSQHKPCDRGDKDQNWKARGASQGAQTRHQLDVAQPQTLSLAEPNVDLADDPEAPGSGNCTPDRGRQVWTCPALVESD